METENRKASRPKKHRQIMGKKISEEFKDEKRPEWNWKGKDDHRKVEDTLTGSGLGGHQTTETQL